MTNFPLAQTRGYWQQLRMLQFHLRMLQFHLAMSLFLLLKQPSDASTLRWCQLLFSNRLVNHRWCHLLRLHLLPTLYGLWNNNGPSALSAADSNSGIQKAPPSCSINSRFFLIGIFLVRNFSINFLCFLKTSLCLGVRRTLPCRTFSAALQIVLITELGAPLIILPFAFGSRDIAKNLINLFCLFNFFSWP